MPSNASVQDGITFVLPYAVRPHDIQNHNPRALSIWTAGQAVVLVYLWPANVPKPLPARRTKGVRLFLERDDDLCMQAPVARPHEGRTSGACPLIGL
jgi:hypothetical protein